MKTPPPPVVPDPPFLAPGPFVHSALPVGVVECMVVLICLTVVCWAAFVVIWLVKARVAR